MSRSLLFQNRLVRLFFLATCCALALPAKAEHQQEDYPYKDLFQPYQAPEGTWNSPWFRTAILERIRAELGWSFEFEYKATFPTHIDASWDPLQVTPGNWFEVAISMDTYNDPDEDHEYVFQQPGVSAFLRDQWFLCWFKNWRLKCGWRTVTNPGYDFLFNIEEDDVAPLGDDIVRYANGISVPTGPPSPLDLVFCINLVRHISMRDRRVVGEPSVSGTARTPDATYKWDQEGETHFLPIHLPEDYCEPNVVLTLDTRYRYKDFRILDSIEFVIFPGTVIEIKIPLRTDLLMEEFFDSLGIGGYLWVENTDAQNLGSGREHPLTVVMPVILKPDLTPTKLAVVYDEFDIPILGTVYLFPHLQATVHNKGCAAAGSFDVKFVGANHGQTLETVRVEGLAKDEIIEVTTTWPIILWDRAFKVYVDSNDVIDEMKETNNTRIKKLTLADLDPYGLLELSDPQGNPITIEFPVDYDPARDGPLVTPIPWMQAMGLASIAIPDPESDPNVYVNWSYIYEIMQRTVQPPGWPNVAIEEPNTLLFSIIPPSNQLCYSLFDAEGLGSPCDICIGFSPDNAPPGVPQLTINEVVGGYGIVGDYNISVSGIVSDANSVLAIIHSRSECVISEYVQKDIDDPCFSFTGLSLLPGWNEIEIIAFDAAGNRTSFAQQIELNLRYDPCDMTSPAVSFIYPEANSFINDASPELTFRVTDIVGGQVGSGIDANTAVVEFDSGNDPCFVYDNGDGVYVKPSGMINFAIPDPYKLPDGEHSLTLFVSDINGNYAQASITFTIDTQSPLLTEVYADPNSFGPEEPDSNTYLHYRLDEEAAVTVSVYAGAHPDNEFYQNDYRITLQYDGKDHNDPNIQLYTPSGRHSIEFNGWVPLLRQHDSEDPNEWDDLDHMDDGLYTFVVKAIDRAGNENEQSDKFLYRTGKIIDMGQSDFVLESSTCVCCSATGVVTLRDTSNDPIPDRLANIRLRSSGNDYTQDPPIIRDVFSGQASHDANEVLTSDPNGQIRFTIDRLETGTDQIDAELMVLPQVLSGGPVSFSLLNGSPQTIDASSICADDVSVDFSEVTIGPNEPARVCQPFSIQVTLKNDATELMQNVTVGVIVTSSRNEAGEQCDYFFDPDGPQSGVMPLRTGGSDLGGGDPNGVASVPILATKATEPNEPVTYSVYLHRDPCDELIGAVEVAVVGICTDPPSSENSSITITPDVIEPNGAMEAAVIVNIRDEYDQPVANTTIALQPISRRNDARANPPILVDLFGDPPQINPDYTIVDATDEDGNISIRLTSVVPGLADVDVMVIAAPGEDVLIEGDHPGDQLAVEGVNGDLVNMESCILSVDTPSIATGQTANLILTLYDRNEPSQPLADTLLGLRISSNRNRPCIPYPFDYSFDPDGPQEHLAAVTTDHNGQVSIPITSMLAGTAQMQVEISTASGLELAGSATVSFDDDDGDTVPNSYDLCPGGDDLIDSDNDGVPDDCEVIDPPPTVTISSTESSPTDANPIPFDIDFSESVNDFDAGDIEITNGNLVPGSFTGSGMNYDIMVAPTSDGDVTVTVPAGVAHDVAGNGNPGPSSHSVTYESVSLPWCWECLTQCHGDSDCDGDVDTMDWPIFRDSFGSTYPHARYHPCGDMDRDGDIDTVDWPEFRDHFGRAVPADCASGGTWPPMP